MAAAALLGHLFQCFANLQQAASSHCRPQISLTDRPVRRGGCSLCSHPHRLLHSSLHTNQPQLLQVPQSWGHHHFCHSSSGCLHMAHLFLHRAYPKSSTRISAQLCSFDIISQIYIILWMIHSQMFAFFIVV